MGVPTVLVIDPDQDSRVIYSLCLEHSGFRVLQTGDAAEGFRLACAELPNVIVTELYLPLIGERHVTEALREDERTARIPLLAVTTLPLRSGRGDRPVRQVDRLLLKPCIPSRMLSEVRRFLDDPAVLAC